MPTPWELTETANYIRHIFVTEKRDFTPDDLTVISDICNIDNLALDEVASLLKTTLEVPGGNEETFDNRQTFYLANRGAVQQVVHVTPIQNSELFQTFSELPQRVKMLLRTSQNPPPIYFVLHSAGHYTLLTATKKDGVLEIQHVDSMQSTYPDFGRATMLENELKEHATELLDMYRGCDRIQFTGITTLEQQKDGPCGIHVIMNCLRTINGRSFPGESRKFSAISRDSAQSIQQPPWTDMFINALRNNPVFTIADNDKLRTIIIKNPDALDNLDKSMLLLTSLYAQGAIKLQPSAPHTELQTLLKETAKTLLDNISSSIVSSLITTAPAAASSSSAPVRVPAPAAASSSAAPIHIAASAADIAAQLGGLRDFTPHIVSAADHVASSISPEQQLIELHILSYILQNPVNVHQIDARGSILHSLEFKQQLFPFDLFVDTPSLQIAINCERTLNMLNDFNYFQPKATNQEIQEAAKIIARHIQNITTCIGSLIAENFIPQPQESNPKTLDAVIAKIMPHYEIPGISNWAGLLRELKEDKNHSLLTPFAQNMTSTQIQQLANKIEIAFRQIDQPDSPARQMPPPFGVVA